MSTPVNSVRMPEQDQPSRRHFLSCLLLAPSVVAHAQASPDESIAQRESRAPGLPAIGTPLAPPAVTLLGGQSMVLLPSAAPLTLFYWWASTCPFCAEQSPEMDKLWRQYRAQGLQMLTLSVDKKPELAQAYLQRKGYSFPAAWVSPALHQRFPKPKGLPITLAIDRQGKVLQAEKGQMFAEDVAKLAQYLST